MDGWKAAHCCWGHMTCKTQDVRRTLTLVFWNTECLKACEILQIIRLTVIRTFRDYSCPVTDGLIFIPRRDFPRGKWWRVLQQSAISNRKGIRGCRGQQQQQQHYCNYYGYLSEPALWLVSGLYWMARGLKMDDTCHDVLFLLILVCRFISLVFKGMEVAAPRLHVWALAIDSLFLTLICCCICCIPGNKIIAVTQMKVYFTLGNTRLVAYANESNGHTTARGCVRI